MSLSREHFNLNGNLNFSWRERGGSRIWKKSSKNSSKNSSSRDLDGPALIHTFPEWTAQKEIDELLTVGRSLNSFECFSYSFIQKSRSRYNQEQSSCTHLARSHQDLLALHAAPCIVEILQYRGRSWIRRCWWLSVSYLSIVDEDTMPIYAIICYS